MTLKEAVLVFWIASFYLKKTLDFKDQEQKGSSQKLVNFVKFISIYVLYMSDL
ncbi:hypothetical protein Pf1_01785 [Flavobacterium columnare]|nr:hypothetical protein Pf1_01785 [Flavobacterium columnare]